MKTLNLLFMFGAINFCLAQEFFQTTTNSTFLNKTIRNDGRIILGEEYGSNYKFQVFKNSLTNLVSAFGNSAGRLEIATVGTSGSYEPNSQPGDIVLKRMGDSHNLTFFMATTVPANTGPNDPQAYKIRFASGNNPNSLVIFNTGKVTMGTSLYDNSEYRLFVKDGIKTEKIKVEIGSANGWADYVFDDNYNLMSLPDLKNYIDENKHLPNIPSTEEVLKEGGVELKDMTVKLLEKVEELTLYVIQQQEEIDRLNKEIEGLKSNQK